MASTCSCISTAGLAIHSHLRMTGSWSVSSERRRWAKAWIIIRARTGGVVQLGGPVLELMTEGRVRFDQRIAGLGPDVLADDFDAPRFLFACATMIPAVRSETR